MLKRLSKNEKGFSAVELIIVLVVIIAIGAGGYLVYRHEHKSTPTTTARSSSTDSVSTSSNPSLQSVTFAGLGITVEYPSSWKVTNNDANVGLIIASPHYQGYSFIVDMFMAPTVDDGSSGYTSISSFTYDNQKAYLVGNYETTNSLSRVFVSSCSAPAFCMFPAVGSTTSDPQGVDASFYYNQGEGAVALPNDPSAISQAEAILSSMTFSQ